MTPDSLATDRAEKERACEAVLKSRTFARSDQLQGFLRYICELELADRGNEITEYSIATAALNRPSDYAPGEDSSVRSRAHSLRRKLHEFYEHEMVDADLRIELPKGSYRPLFVSRETIMLAPLAPPAIPSPSRKSTETSWAKPVLFGASTAMVAAAAILLLAGRFPIDPIDPVVREAWGPTLTEKGDVLIVVGSPPALRISRSGKGAPPKSGPPGLASPDVVSWYENQNLENRGGPLYVMPTRGYAVFADIHAVTQVTTLLTMAGASFQATPDPLVQLMAIHERGLVIIGAPAYTSLSARMLNATPFSIRYDQALGDEVIADGNAVFAPKRNSSNRFSTVYGLITVLPSQPGRSRPERTLIFSGITGSPGAQAAVQYFTSPSALHDLRARFRSEGYAKFPPAYQVVVRCGADKESAINSIYETHRILAATPIIE